MSGYNSKKVEDFYNYSKGMVLEENGKELFNKYKNTLINITPSDVVIVFHKLFEENFKMEDLKKGVNRILHAVYLPLKNFKSPKYSENGLIDLLIKDNVKMEEKLNEIKPLIKKINLKKDSDTIKELKKRFEELLPFTKHYEIKENVIFPFLEKKSEFFGCTQIMWSFDDDIKRNLKEIISLLESNFNLKEFNHHVGRLFFDMYAISFRENKILFPYLLQISDEEEVNKLLKEALEIGIPFVEFKGSLKTEETKNFNKSLYEIDLETGILKPDEISLILNNLPVDITFVNENDEVKYFSNPKDRIFTRTKSILGRKVQNCHPPESIHVVNKIIESFKSGKKDRASFWINFNNKFVLIQYFAVRDENGNYRGVLEVTQDITEIKKLEGEKRLLDWD